MSTTPRFGLGALVKHRDVGGGRVVAYRGSLPKKS
jgi:hypothetical protein